MVGGGCHETQRGQWEEDVLRGVSSRTHMTEKEKTDYTWWGRGPARSGQKDVQRGREEAQKTKCV